MLSSVYPYFCCFSIKLFTGSVDFLLFFLNIEYAWVMLGIRQADGTLFIPPLSSRTSCVTRLSVLPSLNLLFSSSLVLGCILLLQLRGISFAPLENSYATVTKSAASLKRLILRPVAFLFGLYKLIMNLLQSS